MRKKYEEWRANSRLLEVDDRRDTDSRLLMMENKEEEIDLKRDLLPFILSVEVWKSLTGLRSTLGHLFPLFFSLQFFCLSLYISEEEESSCQKRWSKGRRRLSWSFRAKVRSDRRKTENEEKKKNGLKGGRRQQNRWNRKRGGGRGSKKGSLHRFSLNFISHYSFIIGKNALSFSSLFSLPSSFVKSVGITLLFTR